MEGRIHKKERIETRNLVLRPCRPEDREAIADLFMNEEVTATFMVPEYETREEYLHLADIQISFSQPENTGHYLYGIYLEDRIIGFVNDCGFDHEKIEIGYVIDPAFKGRGYATEALKAVITDIREMGFKMALAGYFEENVGSRRVMERSGMVPNGNVDEEDYKGKVHVCHECEIDLTVRDLIYTDRLMVRSLTEADWESILRMNEEFVRSPYVYLDKPKSLDPEGVRAKTRRWGEVTEQGTDHLFFAICLENKAIGLTSMHKHGDTYECGYNLLESYQGKGYAQEGISAIIDIIRGMGARRIEAGTGVDNAPSVALLKRLGFVMTGTEELSFHKNEQGEDITFTGGIFVKEL